MNVCCFYKLLVLNRKIRKGTKPMMDVFKKNFWRKHEKHLRSAHYFRSNLFSFEAKHGFEEKPI